jgi:prepilin-type N-terminal cleavage/methylation domain-containing protein
LFDASGSRPRPSEAWRRRLGESRAPGGPRGAPGRDQRGLTLVELAVAVLLLSVGLVTLALAMPPALQAVVASGRQATATLLAQQAVDQAHARTLDTLCGLDTGGGFLPVGGYAGFTRRIEVTPLAASCPGLPAGGLLVTVTVTVRVTGGGPGGAGDGRETTLVTLRTR